MVTAYEPAAASPGRADETSDQGHLARYLPALLADWDAAGLGRHRNR